MLALALGAASSIAADPYPSRPIRIIVPFAPGGLIDVTSRFVAQKMQESLGQPVVVENRTGADGLIGIRAAKAAPADGYTLLATSNAFALSLATKLDPGYEEKDFVGIGGMNEAALIMVAASSQPDTTLAQFLARAKAKPDSMSFASGGVGTSTWMAAAMLLSQVGVKMVHVPYKGVAAAAPDVQAGRVNMMFDNANTAGQRIKEGKLRAYGVASPKRLSDYPDIPTMAEQGLPHFNYSSYCGLIAPAGTPAEIVKTLSQALRAATSSEEFREFNRRLGSEPLTLPGDAFKERLKQDAANATRLVSEASIPKQ
jgi:tripartite-type tricarboxylate transporter receptor subunit TctC